jgi:hypothetical protein
MKLGKKLRILSVLGMGLGSLSASANSSQTDCIQRQLRFLAEREGESFRTLEAFRSAADEWDKNFVQTILKLGKVKPPSFRYSVVPLVRQKYLEHAWIGRQHFLDELERLRADSLSMTSHQIAEQTVEQFIENTFRRFGVFEATKDQQIKAANQIRKDLKMFEKVSGLPSLQVRELGDAVVGYYERVRELRRTYGSEWLTDETIKDAGFNAVGATVFTKMTGLPLHDKKALDAIALLDPLTDDAIDRGLPVMKSMEKISKILDGKPQKPENSYEKIVFDLIDDIFKAHPPDKDPDVIHGLKLIHEAQLKSIKAQRDPKTSLEEIASLTSRKGGLAVWLASRIAIGRLTRQESEYFYRLGANSQLLDDLVDYNSDLKEKTFTIWTHATNNNRPLAEAFQMLMKSQSSIEEDGAMLLQKMPNYQDILKSTNLGTKLYLSGALTQDELKKALGPLVKGQFPLSPDNLKKAILAVMAKLDVPGDERLKVMEILDKSVFNGMYEAYKKAEKEDPVKLLQQMSGPEPYWSIFKTWTGFKKWNVELAQKDGSLAREFYHFFWFASTMAIPLGMDNRQEGLTFFLSILIAVHSKKPQVALAIWTGGLAYMLNERLHHKNPGPTPLPSNTQ